MKRLEKAKMMHRSNAPIWEYFEDRFHTHPNKYALLDQHSEERSKTIFNESLQSVSGGRKRAIYIHVPYCKDYCTYCYFLKKIPKGQELELFVIAVKNHIYNISKSIWAREKEFDAIYFGGGTPTTLSRNHLKDIIETIKRNLPIASDCEISTECRIGQVSLKYLEGLPQIGFNRISIGIQSFDDRVRMAVGRHLSRDELVAKLTATKKLKFKSVCADLLYPLPHQTLEIWKNDISNFLELGLHGCSVYRLNVREGTDLWQQLSNKTITLQESKELEYNFFTKIDRALGNDEWKRLTAVNYGRKGAKEAVYLRYQNDIRYDTLGLGPGATGQINNCLYSNTRNIDEYNNSMLFNTVPYVKVWKSNDYFIKAWRWQRLSINNYISISSDLLKASPSMERVINDLLQINLINTNGDELVLTEQGRFWSRTISDIIQHTIVGDCIGIA